MCVCVCWGWKAKHVSSDRLQHIVVAYPERMNYLVMQCVAAFKSSWSWQRANAAYVVGFLLGNLPLESRKGAFAMSDSVYNFFHQHLQLPL